MTASQATVVQCIPHEEFLMQMRCMCVTVLGWLRVGKGWGLKSQAFHEVLANP